MFYKSCNFSQVKKTLSKFTFIEVSLTCFTTFNSLSSYRNLQSVVYMIYKHSVESNTEVMHPIFCLKSRWGKYKVSTRVLFKANILWGLGQCLCVFGLCLSEVHYSKLLYNFPMIKLKNFINFMVACLSTFRKGGSNVPFHYHKAFLLYVYVYTVCTCTKKSANILI